MLFDDTDVLIILLCNPSRQGSNVVHILKDSAHFLGQAFYRMGRVNVKGKDLAMVYAIARCDFTPSSFGIGHQMFLSTFLKNANSMRTLDICIEGNEDNFESLVCYDFLSKYGRTVLCCEDEGRRRVREALSATKSIAEIGREAKRIDRAMFISEKVAGSAEWRVDVRNFIADCGTCAN